MLFCLSAVNTDPKREALISEGELLIMHLEHNWIGSLLWEISLNIYRNTWEYHTITWHLAKRSFSLTLGDRTTEESSGSTSSPADTLQWDWAQLREGSVSITPVWWRQSRPDRKEAQLGTKLPDEPTQTHNGSAGPSGPRVVCCVVHLSWKNVPLFLWWVSRMTRCFWVWAKEKSVWNQAFKQDWCQTKQAVPFMGGRRTLSYKRFLQT